MQATPPPQGHSGPGLDQECPNVYTAVKAGKPKTKPKNAARGTHSVLLFLRAQAHSWCSISVSSLGDEHLCLGFACIIKALSQGPVGVLTHFGEQMEVVVVVSGLLEVGPHRASVRRLQAG